MQSRGFVSPFGRDEAAMSHGVGSALWLTLGGEDKILPSSVVNDALGKKIAEYENKEGRKLGGKARKRLKEDLVHELLPRAFVKPMRLDASVDLQERLHRHRHLLAQVRRGFRHRTARMPWAVSPPCR